MSINIDFKKVNVNFENTSLQMDLNLWPKNSFGENINLFESRIDWMTLHYQNEYTHIHSPWIPVYHHIFMYQDCTKVTQVVQKICIQFSFNPFYSLIIQPTTENKMVLILHSFNYTEDKAIPQITILRNFMSPRLNLYCYLRKNNYIESWVLLLDVYIRCAWRFPVNYCHNQTACFELDRHPYYLSLSSVPDCANSMLINFPGFDYKKYYDHMYAPCSETQARVYCFGISLVDNQKNCIKTNTCQAVLVIQSKLNGLNFNMLTRPDCGMLSSLLIIWPVKDIGYTHGLKFVCKYNEDRSGPSITVDYVVPKGLLEFPNASYILIENKSHKVDHIFRCEWTIKNDFDIIIYNHTNVHFSVFEKNFYLLLEKNNQQLNFKQINFDANFFYKSKTGTNSFAIIWMIFAFFCTLFVILPLLVTILLSSNDLESKQESRQERKKKVQ